MPILSLQVTLQLFQLIAFRIISGYVVGPLLNLATSWQKFPGVALSMERLSDVIDAIPEDGDNDLDQLPYLQLLVKSVSRILIFDLIEGSPLSCQQRKF